MTQQPVEPGERWEKRVAEYREGIGGVMVRATFLRVVHDWPEGVAAVEYEIGERILDAILADHERAARVRPLVEALEAIIAVADKQDDVLAEIRLMPVRMQNARLKEHNRESDVALRLARAALDAAKEES